MHLIASHYIASHIAHHVDQVRCYWGRDTVDERSCARDPIYSSIISQMIQRQGEQQQRCVLFMSCCRDCDDSGLCNYCCYYVLIAMMNMTGIAEWWMDKFADELRSRQGNARSGRTPCWTPRQGSHGLSLAREGKPNHTLQTATREPRPGRRRYQSGVTLVRIIAGHGACMSRVISVAQCPDMTPKQNSEDFEYERQVM